MFSYANKKMLFRHFTPIDSYSYKYVHANTLTQADENTHVLVDLVYVVYVVQNVESHGMYTFHNTNCRTYARSTTLPTFYILCNIHMKLEDGGCAG